MCLRTRLHAVRQMLLPARNRARSVPRLRPPSVMDEQSKQDETTEAAEPSRTMMGCRGACPRWGKARAVGAKPPLSPTI